MSPYTKVNKPSPDVENPGNYYPINQMINYQSDQNNEIDEEISEETGGDIPPYTFPNIIAKISKPDTTPFSYEDYCRYHYEDDGTQTIKTHSQCASSPGCEILNLDNFESTSFIEKDCYLSIIDNKQLDNLDAENILADNPKCDNNREQIQDLHDNLNKNYKEKKILNDIQNQGICVPKEEYRTYVSKFINNKTIEMGEDPICIVHLLLLIVIQISVNRYTLVHMMQDTPTHTCIYKKSNDYKKIRYYEDRGSGGNCSTGTNADVIYNKCYQEGNINRKHKYADDLIYDLLNKPGDVNNNLSFTLSDYESSILSHLNSSIKQYAKIHETKSFAKLSDGEIYEKLLTYGPNIACIKLYNNDKITQINIDSTTTNEKYYIYGNTDIFDEIDLYDNNSTTEVWPILSEQKTKDTGYYVNSFNSTYPSLVPPPSENVGSNDTFQRSLYQNNRLPNIEGSYISYNPNIEKNMILDNYVESENDTFDNIQKMYILF